MRWFLKCRRSLRASRLGVKLLLDLIGLDYESNLQERIQGLARCRQAMHNFVTPSTVGVPEDPPDHGGQGCAA